MLEALAGAGATACRKGGLESGRADVGAGWTALGTDPEPVFCCTCGWGVVDAEDLVAFAGPGLGDAPGPLAAGVAVEVSRTAASVDEAATGDIAGDAEAEVCPVANAGAGKEVEGTDDEANAGAEVDGVELGVDEGGGVPTDVGLAIAVAEAGVGWGGGGMDPLGGPYWSTGRARTRDC